MASFPLDSLTSFTARCLFYGERIDTRSLETGSVLGTAPLTFRAGESGCAVLFKYGIVVLFNLTPIEEVSFLKHLNDLVLYPVKDPEVEELEIRVEADEKEGMRANCCYLRTIDLERVQLLAEILARNSVLSHYEPRVAQAFDSIEPIALELKRRSPLRRRNRELLQLIGDSLLIEHKMVGRVEVAEKPEVLWDSPELEGLYARLEDEYEVRERHVAIERKLALISRTAETLLDLLQTWRSHRVEWYIAILIVFEICLTLFEMFFGKP